MKSDRFFHAEEEETAIAHYNVGKPGSVWIDMHEDFPIRKIEASPWISMKDRLPGAYPALVLASGKPVVARNGFENGGRYPRRWPRGIEGELLTFDELATITHWMPIPEAPEPVEEPIYVRGDLDYEVHFLDNGDIKVGCTTVPKEKMEKIVERWKGRQQ